MLSRRLLEETGVDVEGRLAAQVGVEHVGLRWYLAVADHVDQAGEGLALVDRIRDHRLQRCSEAHRVERSLIGDAVRAGVEAIVEDDLLVSDLSLDANERGRGASDSRDLGPGLLRFGGRVDTDDGARIVVLREARDDAGL